MIISGPLLGYFIYRLAQEAERKYREAKNK